MSTRASGPISRAAVLGWSAYVALVLTVAYRAYPQILERRTAGSGRTERPPKSYIRIPVTTHRAAEPGGAATSMYRSTPDRRGADATARVPLAVSPKWSREPLNAGLHVANDASPAVDDTGAYVGTDTSWFYAFGFDGSVRWKFFVANAPYGIHGTAALDQGRVYFGAQNGVLYSLDKRDGGLVWALKLSDAIAASPALLGEVLYVSAMSAVPRNSFIAKVDKESGRVVWLSAGLGGQSLSSPVIDERTGRICVGANNGRVVVIDPKTGDIVTSFAVNGAVEGAGVTAEGRGYFLTRRNWLTAFAIAEGRPLFAVELPHAAVPGTGTVASPSWVPSAGTLLASAGGRITAVDGLTGAIVWTEAPDGLEPLGTGASLLVRTPNTDRWIAWMACGRLDLCALDPLTGAVLERKTLKSRLTGAPVAHKNALFVALHGEGGLVRFDGF